MESLDIDGYPLSGWTHACNTSHIYIYTSGLMVLRCNQMEVYPMCIVGNLAWHCAICALCTQALVQQYKQCLDLCVCGCMFVCFFHINIILFFTPLFSPPPFFFLSVFVCACMHMTSIWWIKSNALILSQTRPLLHVRSEIPCVRNCIPPHVIQGDRKQCNNRVLTADPCLPQNQQAVALPLCSSYVTIKSLQNTTK